ncbi:precorrin-6y C5,15-methyltransferase (decarboxylating) subunit CbiE [Desulfococcaceae bacterium HSG9]|nr:precorrin-6y C5,15-methyltransferase (decarboxylating) subunit CbiE [Desulfococcaceae bacterium HSG9]
MIKTVNIIGMGLTPHDLTDIYKEIIEKADILIGGERHLSYFTASATVKKTITKDLKGLITYIRTNMTTRRIVILASGDPLFFGIGELIINAVGPEHVCVHPNISSVAAAFARAKMSWSNVGVVSLHGRNHKAEFLQMLKIYETVAVFTDPQNNPAWLSGLLISKGLNNYLIGVFEKLGTSDEKIGWYEAALAADMTFGEPNVVIIKPKPDTGPKFPRLCLGMPDDAFEHERGLVTKKEIRAVSLAKLKLLPEHTLWDLGAGSGAVSIEASVLLHRGMIVAVEQKTERVAHIHSNIRHFGVTNMDVVQAVLPDGLDKLPHPDRVFIGGGGRHLDLIINTAASFMSPGGIMVVNTVLLSNLERTLKIMRAQGFDAEAVQVQVCMTKPMPWNERFESGNPVWIISGIIPFAKIKLPNTYS